MTNPMTGSEKQIAWAETIRAEWIAVNAPALEKFLSGAAAALEAFRADPAKFAKHGDVEAHIAAKIKAEQAAYDSIVGRETATSWIDDRAPSLHAAAAAIYAKAA